MSETYAQMKARLLNGLIQQGWKVSSNLKIPHATRSDGFRLWFKTQSVYFGFSSSFSDARSTHSDFRNIEFSKFLQDVDYWSK